jgi:hypothetical protein
MQTVTNTKSGVVVAEACGNAAQHGAKDRSANHGVTNADAQAAAVLNMTTAAE